MDPMDAMDAREPMGAVDRAGGTSSAARAVGSLLAPVVACLRDDRDGYGVLVEATLEDDAVLGGVVRAAPAVARIYLRLAPPPGGAQTIVDSYDSAARTRFRDDDVVSLGHECLQVASAIARVPQPLAEIAKDVFVREARDHGDEHALEGAVASVWWSAYLSARLRGVDPVEEAAAICRYAARVA
jgi:hypothetical protein